MKPNILTPPVLVQTEHKTERLRKEDLSVLWWELLPGGEYGFQKTRATVKHKDGGKVTVEIGLSMNRSAVADWLVLLMPKPDFDKLSSSDQPLKIRTSDPRIKRRAIRGWQKIKINPKSLLHRAKPGKKEWRQRFFTWEVS